MEMSNELKRQISDFIFLVRENVIMDFCELIRSNAITDEQREFADKVDFAADQFLKDLKRKADLVPYK